MARYGAMYGPDYTFLGVPACDLDDASTWEAAQAVVIGAPYDGGTSHRAGARFGPRAVRAACYLTRSRWRTGDLPPFDPAQRLLDGR